MGGRRIFGSGKAFVVGEWELLEVLRGCPFAVMEIPFLL